MPSLGIHTIGLLSCRKIKTSQGCRWMPCHCLPILRHLALSKHLLGSVSAAGHASELFIVKPGCCGNRVTAGKSQLCLWLHLRFETNWLHTCSNFLLLYDKAIDCYLFSLCVFVYVCVCEWVCVCVCVWFRFVLQVYNPLLMISVMWEVFCCWHFLPSWLIIVVPTGLTWKESRSLC